MEYARGLPENAPERDAIELGAIEAEMNTLEEIPEPLLILKMLEFSATTYWFGGLADQPYLLMKELNAAATGEKRHIDLRNLNRLMEMS